MLAPDTILQSRYRIVRSIGQGGMGSVYMATDQRLRNTVALKETLFTDEKLRRAFEHEAELLANLHHPALPGVSDHFVEGEGQFLVMQFIQGVDLSELLKEKGSPFSTEEVLRWADQLLDALDYLHTQDPVIIHRDIKPQNLKLTARGQIILLDFGLAKGTPLQISRVTTSGSIFGYTPNYAPLEQIHGTGTDVRSDIYSLGATLYALITATTPPDALSRATALIGEQPDPLRPAIELNPRVPAAVAAVLMRAMAQNKNQRYSSADEMRRAIQSAQSVTVADQSEARTVLMPPGAAATVAQPAEVQAGSNETARLEGVHTRAVTALPSGSPAAGSGSSSELPHKTETETELATRLQKAPAGNGNGFKWAAIAITTVLVAAIAGSVGLYKATRQKTDTQATQPVVQQSNAPASDQSPVQSVAQQPQTGSSPAAVESTPVTPPSTPSEPNSAATTQTARANSKQSSKRAKSDEVTPEAAPTPQIPSEFDPETQRQIEDAMREAEAARHAGEEAKQAGRRLQRMRIPAAPPPANEMYSPPKAPQNPNRMMQRRNPDGSTTTMIVRPGGRVIRYTQNPDGTMRGKPQITKRP
jgi:serine/threonine protein kinase